MLVVYSTLVKISFIIAAFGFDNVGYFNYSTFNSNLCSVVFILTLNQSPTVKSIILRMSIFLVVPHLFISNEAASAQEDLLSQHQIENIVSLGCTPATQYDRIKYLAFPSILDTPETVLLDIFQSTSLFIDEAVKRKQNVLVHCIYGQSRSASVIVAYMLMHSQRTLAECLSIMKSQNPTTCINPGFLAQLYYISEFPDYLNSSCVSLQMLRLKRLNGSEPQTSGIKRKSDTSISQSDIMKQHYDEGPGKDLVQESTLVCKLCRGLLAPASSVLKSTDPASLVSQYVDEFWRGYQPARPKNIPKAVLVPVKGHWTVYPSTWMIKQVEQSVHNQDIDNEIKTDINVNSGSTINNLKNTNKNKNKDNSVDSVSTAGASAGASTGASFGAAGKECECTLLCPHCHVEVGKWRANQLNLIGIYNTCDLYLLAEASVRLKRFLKRF